MFQIRNLLITLLVAATTSATQFSNPETSTLLSSLIPESTTPKHESWDEFWNEVESNDYDILFYDYVKKVKWMRAKDIAERYGYERPRVFKENHTRFDINQGGVGDCWFLAALALLPAYPKVFDNVMDRKQTFDNNPAGKYNSYILTPSKDFNSISRDIPFQVLAIW